jgi:hypothetical protein
MKAKHSRIADLVAHQERYREQMEEHYASYVERRRAYAREQTRKKKKKTCTN